VGEQGNIREVPGSLDKKKGEEGAIFNTKQKVASSSAFFLFNEPSKGSILGNS
jgi:hypothetical protein